MTDAKYFRQGIMNGARVRRENGAFASPTLSANSRLDLLRLKLSCFLTMLLSAPNAFPDELIKADAPVLERIGREYSSNRDQIRTWRGVVNYRHEQSHGIAGPMMETEKAAIRFAFDKPRGWSFTFYQQSAVPEQGAPRLEATMLTDDGFYVYNSYPPESFPPAFQPILRIQPPADGRRPGGQSERGRFSPFDASSPTGAVASLVLGYAKLIKEGKELKGRRLTRDGSHVTLKNELGGVSNEYVFSLDTGSSLIGFAVAGAEPEVKWKCEIVRINEVYVPSRITRESFANGQRTLQHFDWQDQVINEPLAHEVFSIKALGVHRGDKVHDVRSGRIYLIHDENLPGRATPGVEDSLRRTDGQARRRLIIVFLISALAMAGLLLIRKIRKLQPGA